MFGYEDVEPLQLQELLQAEEILLIDVRTPTESARGGIPGARNIPLHLLPLRKEELSDDRIKYDYLPQRRKGRKEKHRIINRKIFASFVSLRRKLLIQRFLSCLPCAVVSECAAPQ